MSLKKAISYLLMVCIITMTFCAVPAAAGAADYDVYRTLRGDIDGDSDVTSVDVTYLQRNLAYMPVSDFCEEAADTDGDGAVTIFDATYIQRWLAKMPVTFSIGEPIFGWVEKNESTKANGLYLGDIIIDRIYEDCFFAHTVIAFPYEIKVNGSISDQWCIGDQVICSYENIYYDEATWHVEADLRTIEPSYFVPDPYVAYKPVIYLYPEEETEVSVKLSLNGEFVCTYPEYRDGWTVTASPDGTLTDTDGLRYNYLYWEANLNTAYDFSEGFCVKGSDTAAFLEKALAELGLDRREANEFIVFWLAQMQNNPYNIISFQTDAYTDAAVLDVTPQPDSVIRVFMAWQPVEEYIPIPEQELTAPDRNGFTVVEWGGSRV